ncbi:hypothetical protein ACNFBR_15305 [Pseudomonas sp. NY11955]|uniref:hypothetical protein n=1 Tax=Pseudomonas sp. NY11955 TaxID=3400363 RepID=UPI003A836A7A
MDTPSNTPSASTVQKLINFIHALANLIKSLGAILGFITAAYAVAVNYFPTSAIGALFAGAGDPFVATQRFSEGFLYYEVGRKGEQTSYGKLVVLPGGELPDFNTLTEGLVLQATDKVYLRPKPTTDEDFIRVLGKGQCFTILKIDRELAAGELRNAKNGGWLRVRETTCPQ